MKTIFIYVDFESLPNYFMVDGDYRHFDGVLVNTGNNPELEDELCDFLFNEYGTFKHETGTLFPITDLEPGDHVVACGFVP